MRRHILKEELTSQKKKKASSHVLYILYRRFYTHTTETLAFLFQHAQGPCTRSFELGCWHFTSDEIDFLFHLSLWWLHQPSLMTLHGSLKLCGSLKLHENACGIGRGGGRGTCKAAQQLTSCVPQSSRFLPYGSVHFPYPFFSLSLSSPFPIFLLHDSLSPWLGFWCACGPPPPGCLYHLIFIYKMEWGMCFPPQGNEGLIISSLCLKSF